LQRKIGEAHLRKVLHGARYGMRGEEPILAGKSSIRRGVLDALSKRLTKARPGKAYFRPKRSNGLARA